MKILENTLIFIKECADEALKYNNIVAEGEDKYLSEYLKSVKTLKYVVNAFYKYFDDFMMEIEESERIKWEEEQINIEEDYYSGV